MKVLWSGEKVSKNFVDRVFVFLMGEMDSAPSKTFGTPKNLKFNNYNLNLQKSLPKFR